MAGGINPYVYVQNNPINFIDPLGLNLVGWWEAITVILKDITSTRPGVVSLLKEGILMDDYGPGKEYVLGEIKKLEDKIKTEKEKLIKEHYACLFKCDADYSDPCENQKCRLKCDDNYTNAAMTSIIPDSDKLTKWLIIKDAFLKY